MNILYLIIGGSIGTTLRYFTGQLAGQAQLGVFPLGTLLVNLIGSLIIGFLWGFLNTDTLPTSTKNLVFVGMLGSFTTYSTYMLDVFNLARMGEWKLSIFYLLLSNIIGLLLVAGGFFLGSRLKLA